MYLCFNNCPIIASPIDHTSMAPTANADRFIKTPKNNPKEKKPSSFTKNANKYPKSRTISVNS